MTPAAAEHAKQATHEARNTSQILYAYAAAWERAANLIAASRWDDVADFLSRIWEYRQPVVASERRVKEELVGVHRETPSMVKPSQLYPPIELQVVGLPHDHDLARLLRRLIVGR